MRLTKRLATTGAAVSLAAAGLVGLTATAAHADGCTNLSTRYQAVIHVCAHQDGYPGWVGMSYSVLTPGSTDERVWFKVESSSGEKYFSGNDVQEPNWSLGYTSGSLTGGYIRSVEVYTTESGVQDSNSYFPVYH
ncbi:hypothetical protein BX285_2854 [Streptomyces sp. 1114.5]|uniref:hypothetical protein n=1 Tax=unclassified Streptomyces TaxID=2593676 RepID=UPI000BD6DC7E|nr:MULTISPECIES: hypothetical protein [unclassified Streptomyces]RKT18431.1 hypothetical protein BX285_2854 [Streptomyces sp. 1114.5]SOB84626.1 hypothetical protein SAMN06272789_4883 [Streptomyces sp. 1331.2]